MNIIESIKQILEYNLNLRINSYPVIVANVPNPLDYIRHITNSRNLVIRYKPYLIYDKDRDYTYVLYEQKNPLIGAIFGFGYSLFYNYSKYASSKDEFKKRSMREDFLMWLSAYVNKKLKLNDLDDLTGYGFDDNHNLSFEEDPYLEEIIDTLLEDAMTIEEDFEESTGISKQIFDYYSNLVDKYDRFGAYFYGLPIDPSDSKKLLFYFVNENLLSKIKLASANILNPYEIEYLLVSEENPNVLDKISSLKEIDFDSDGSVAYIKKVLIYPNAAQILFENGEKIVFVDNDFMKLIFVPIHFLQDSIIMPNSLIQEYLTNGLNLTGFGSIKTYVFEYLSEILRTSEARSITNDKESIIKKLYKKLLISFNSEHVEQDLNVKLEKLSAKTKHNLLRDDLEYAIKSAYFSILELGKDCTSGLKRWMRDLVKRNFQYS